MAFNTRPPSEDLLTLLFNPVWKKGLGVYRPAFFNSWPFPRVQCGLSFGDRNGYSYSGGCNWSAAAPAPEHLAAGRSITRTSVTIRATQVSRDQPRQPAVDMMLTIHNNGTVTAQSITLDSITLRTLAGAGQATLVGPGLPIQLNNLQPGESTSVFLKLNVPPGARADQPHRARDDNLRKLARANVAPFQRSAIAFRAINRPAVK